LWEKDLNKVIGNERGKPLINFCRQHDLVVMNMWLKKRKPKTVHMEEHRRQEKLPNQFHSNEAILQE
jgi:hypothetical protein